MLILNLPPCFPHRIAEWKSAPNSKQTFIWSPSIRSYIILALKFYFKLFCRAFIENFHLNTKQALEKAIKLSTENSNKVLRPKLLPFNCTWTRPSDSLFRLWIVCICNNPIFFFWSKLEWIKISKQCLLLDFSLCVCIKSWRSKSF